MKVSIFCTCILAVLVSFTYGASTAAQDLIGILPGCVGEANSQDVAECLVLYSDPTCFNESSVSELSECFQEELEVTTNRNTSSTANEVYATSIECLEPYVDCINETLTDALEDLPPCAETTALALGQCFVDNAESCAEPCLATLSELLGDDGESPFADLGPADVINCRLVEENIIHVGCGYMNCCPPCLDAYEDVAECVINDVLDLYPSDCTFECDNTGVRRLRDLSEKEEIDEHEPTTRRLVVETESATRIWDACKFLTPGIVGGRDIATIVPGEVQVDAVVDLLARVNFFDCLAHEALGIYDVNKSDPTQSPPTSSSFSLSLFWDVGMAVSTTLVTTAVVVLGRE